VQPLFVFCADLHLEDGAWSSRPAIYGDAYYSFEQIIDYCIANKLPLIMGGDILEKKQNLARPIAKLCDGLTQMQEALVPAYYIQGNHEYDRNAPWLSVHSWPMHLHKKCLPFGSIDGPRVYGLDWLPRGEIQEEFKQVPADTDILITHQVWKDFMGNVGRTECELTDVHHVNVVLAGDFHVTKTIESVNAHGQPIRMLSPGSTAMQDIGETPEKFFFVISKAENGEIVFEPKALNTRPFLKYTAETQDDLDELCSGSLVACIDAAIAGAKERGMPEHIQKPLVRIKFNKELPDAWLRLTTAVGERAHTFCDPLVDGGAVKTSRAANDTKNDVLSALESLLGQDSAAYKLAAAVYSADDPAKEVDVLFQQHMKKETVDAVAETGSEELGAPQAADL
jgi:hypothetical protein